MSTIERNGSAVVVAEGGDEPTVELSRDEIFDVLCNQRRRLVLQALGDHPEGLSLRELSELVAARECETTPGAVTTDQRKRTYISLYQTHIPKMDRLGVVEVDGQGHTVRLTDAVSQFDVYLEVVPPRGISWSTYYGGLAGFGLVLAAALAAGAHPLTELPGVVYLTFFSLVLAVSAAVNTLENRRSRLDDDELTGLPHVR